MGTEQNHLVIKLHKKLHRLEGVLLQIAARHEKQSNSPSVTKSSVG